MDHLGQSSGAEWLLSALDSAQVEPLPPGPARFLGPYRLGSLLGRGATSVVLRAEHSHSGGRCALKVVHLDGVQVATAARIENEARALERLHHPGIVRVLDWGREGELFYLALEEVDGQSLGERLARSGPLEEREALDIALQVARALDHAHQQGVVHRDVKPNNILLDRSGRARLSDFGLARLVDRATRYTQEGDVLGTPGFMAPEQASAGGSELKPNTDVYGLGATLYACLSGGTPPIQAATLHAFLAALQHSRPRPLRAVRPGTSLRTERFCMRCLEHSPERRFQSAGAVAAALEKLLNAEPRRSHGWRAWPAVVGSLLLAAAATVGILSQQGPQASQTSDDDVPDVDDAWVAYQACLARGEAKQARVALERVLVLDPTHPHALEAHAERALEAGDFEAAASDLAAVGEAAPNAARVWRLRGLIEVKRGDYAAAASAFARAAEGGVSVSLPWADALYRTGALAEAAAVAEAALVKDPHSAALHQLCTDAAHHQGLLKKAMRLARRWQQALPDDPDSYRAEGDTRLRAGDPVGAEAPLRRAIALDPQDPVARGLLAESFKERGQFERALEIYDASLALSPNASALWNNRAGALIELGRIEEALACYARALELNPGNPEVHAYRALAWTQAGQLGRALADAREATQRGPTLAITHFVLSQVLRHHGELEQALGAAERALALDPNHFRYLMCRADLLLSLHRADEALQEFEQLIPKFPRSGELRFGRALALFELARIDEARAQAKDALNFRGEVAFRERVEGFLRRLPD